MSVDWTEKCRDEIYADAYYIDRKFSGAGYLDYPFDNSEPTLESQLPYAVVRADGTVNWLPERPPENASKP